MTRARLLLAPLVGALLLSASVLAQPGGPPRAPGGPGGPGGGPGPDLTLPVVPKSAGAFVSLKVSALADHPDLKPVLAQLVKQPDALAGITEVIGLSPLEIDRVTLFWPRSLAAGPGDPVLVVTTREPFNEARVLKALRAQPVFDDDRGGRGGKFGAGAAAPKAVAPDFKDIKPPPFPEPPPLSAPPPFPKGPALPPPPKPEEDAAELCSGAGGDGGPGDPLFYELERGAFEALFLVDERTLVFLPGGRFAGETSGLALLAAMLKKNASGPLADAIGAAGRHTFAAGANLAPVFKEFDRGMPRELVPYTALFAARTAVITGDLQKGAQLNLTLKFDDATAARRAAPVLEEGIATVATKLGALANELNGNHRPFDKAAAPLWGAFAGALKKAQVKADGPAVLASTEVDAGPVMAKAVGELLQAVQSRKKAEARMNNLKQIGLALHNYHDATGKFPTNVYGPKGELLLSWRVHLLPYLEEDNLYRQFKMDEAWDGPNNKLLIEQMPKVYQAPDRDAPKGMTYYQGFIGPDPRKPLPPGKGFFGSPWLREGDRNGIRMADIHDGTSNTLAVIEAGRGVIWSKPDDLPFGGAVPPLGEKGWDRTPALRFDGSVLMFPTNMPAELFWKFVTINGGEVTADPDDRGPFGARPKAADPTVETAPAAKSPAGPPK